MIESAEAANPFPFEIDWVTLGAAGFLAVLLLGLGIAARFARRDSAGGFRQRPQNAAQLLLKYSPDPSEGYDTLRAFAPEAPGANGRLAVMARSAVEHGPGVSSRDGAVVYKGGRTMFQVLVLEGASGWQKGSSLYFGGGASEPVLVQDALDAEPVRALARDVEEVICLGLATSETADPPRDKTLLSYERTIHLCRAMINLGLVKRERVIGIAIGEAAHNGDERAGEAAAQPRAAILVGVRQSFRPDMEADVIQAAVDLLAAHGLRLDGFSLSDAPVEFWNVAGGGFTGFIEPEWERVDATSLRGI